MTKRSGQKGTRKRAAGGVRIRRIKKATMMMVQP